jgi:hypothetical protein
MAYEEKRVSAVSHPETCQLRASSTRTLAARTGSTRTLRRRGFAVALLSIALQFATTSSLLAGLDEVDDAIILDNDAEGTSSEGLWFRVSNEDDWGPNFRVTTSTESNATYRFRVDVPSAREYEVFLWWPSSNQLFDRVVAEVKFADEKKMVRVNQTQNGGQ